MKKLLLLIIVLTAFVLLPGSDVQAMNGWWGSPYGDYCPMQGWYGAKKPVKTTEEAKKSSMNISKMVPL